MSIHNSLSGDSPIAEASGNPLIGSNASAAILIIFSTLTTNCEVSATTDVLPERCASTMKLARQSQVPNIAAAARMCTNLMAKMVSSIAMYRHCEEQIDEAIQSFVAVSDCLASFAMTMPSERNLVVHIAARGSGRGRSGDLARRSGRTELAGVIGIGAAGRSAAGAPGAVEQRQFAAKSLQPCLGRIAILAGLVLPFAGLQRALNENFRALFQILLGDPTQILVEDDDAVPFGFLAPFAGGLVLPGLRRRQPQIGDWPAVLGATDFRIGAQIADQNDLVHASRHGFAP